MYTQRVNKKRIELYKWRYGSESEINGHMRLAASKM